eukprot:9205518-Alexandrium_andersonii.AAC.1
MRTCNGWDLDQGRLRGLTEHVGESESHTSTMAAVASIVALLVVTPFNMPPSIAYAPPPPFAPRLRVSLAGPIPEPVSTMGWPAGNMEEPERCMGALLKEGPPQPFW